LTLQNNACYDSDMEIPAGEDKNPETPQAIEVMEFLDSITQQHQDFLATVQTALQEPTTNGLNKVIDCRKAMNDAMQQLRANEFFRLTGDEVLVKGSVANWSRWVIDIANLVNKIKPDAVNTKNLDMKQDTFTSYLLGNSQAGTKEKEESGEDEAEEEDLTPEKTVESLCEAYEFLADFAVDNLMETEKVSEFVEKLEEKEIRHEEIKAHALFAGEVAVGTFAGLALFSAARSLFKRR